MGNLTNIAGAAGEYLCGTELMRPVAGRGFMFDAVLLAGKAPTFDYIVYLLDKNGDRLGPFFFLQVKTTQKKPGASGAYAIVFRKIDVVRAIASKVPMFLCVVDRSTPRSEKIFIKGVDFKRSKGISRLEPVHDLATDAVKIALYDEVARLWAAQATPALAKFI